MRPILLIMFVATLLAGCDPYHHDQVAQTSTTPGVFEAQVGEEIWKFTYLEVDGHQYLVFDGRYRGGITHSPKCSCRRREP